MQEVVFIRIYIKEGDKSQGHDLMKEIFNLLHDHYKVRGVTVFRGIAGFGSKGVHYADDLLRINVHLPLVIEFFDEPEVIEGLLPSIVRMVPAEHIVRWKAECVTDSGIGIPDRKNC